MFSGFYLAFALLLVGLIVRGIGIEYRGKAETAAGRAWCDAGFAAGSLIPALLLGVAFGNLLRGVRMDAAGNMTSGFFSLLNPYALLGGLTTLTLFAFHGAVFLLLRSSGPVHAATARLLPRLAIVTGAIAVAFLAWTSQVRGGSVSRMLAVVIAVAFLVAALNVIRGREALAFAASAVTTLLVPIWVFACLWPDVLPARNHAAWSLTVHNASSSHYTLTVMTIVALIMTPIVLAYQAWSYWVFRARVTGSDLGGDGYGGGGSTRPAGPDGGALGRTITAARRSARDMLGDGTAKPHT
jgi:cytochrome d ubiquinol oxidase subunit II